MRGARRHRPSMAAALSMVSLMDIFTILLLFLLTSATAEHQTVPATDVLRLPASTSEVLPNVTLTIMVTAQDIIVDDKPVAKVTAALEIPELLIPELYKEMTYQAEKAKFIAGQSPDGAFRGTVNVMAHKTLPFRLLSKVLYTSAQAEFGNVSLSVMQREKGGAT